MTTLAYPPLFGTSNSIQTREDWEAYCAHQPPPRPPALTRLDYANLGDAERLAYDGARAAWHGDFGIGSTPALKAARARFQMLVQLNRHSNDPVRAHLTLTGAPNQGKTRVVRFLGQEFERPVRAWLRAHPGELDGAEEICAVVCYSLDSETTTRSLNVGLLQFLGTPLSVTRRYTASQLETAVAQVFARHRVQLLILDDIHLLRPGRHNTEGVRNYLKALTSKVPIMLLLAGIELEKTDLFEETRDSTGLKAGQTGGRTGLIRVERFLKGSVAWLDLLGWIEAQFVLLDHPPGTLQRLQAYLWNRTQGSIGSLLLLLRLAAMTCVALGTERITRKLLDRIEIDYNAETHGNRSTT